MDNGVFVVFCLVGWLVFGCAVVDDAVDGVVVVDDAVMMLLLMRADLSSLRDGSCSKGTGCRVTGRMPSGLLAPGQMLSTLARWGSF